GIALEHRDVIDRQDLGPHGNARGVVRQDPDDDDLVAEPPQPHRQDAVDREIGVNRAGMTIVNLRDQTAERVKRVDGGARRGDGFERWWKLAWPVDLQISK